MKKGITFLTTSKSMVLAMGLLVGFTACKNNSNQENSSDKTPPPVNIDSLNTPKKEVAEFKFDIAMLNIPASFKQGDMTAKNSTPFNASLLNPTTNAVKYNDAFKQAINLGIYGVDLGY